MSFGVSAVVEVREKVAALAAGFDPALVTAADAQRIVEEAAAAEHMWAGIRAKAAARVAETELWRKGGDKSPAHYLARTSGSSVTAAQQALDTAERLSKLPRLDAAVRKGEVSPAQAGAIADAASANPGAEARLLKTAERSSLGELKDECARAKAAAQRDAEARYRAVHAARFLRHRRCVDGANELTYRSTPDEVAEVLAAIRGFGDEQFRLARTEGRWEREEAYLADGLLEMARAAAAVELQRPPLVAAGAEEPADDGGSGPPPEGGAGRTATSSAGDQAAPAPRRRRNYGPLIELMEEVGEYQEAAQLRAAVQRWAREDAEAAASGGGGDQTGAGGERGDAGHAGRPGTREAVGGGAHDSAGAGNDRAGPTSATRRGGSTTKADDARRPSGGGGPPPAGPNRTARRAARRRRMPAQIVVHIDWDALLRGFPLDGERCEIPGIGPVPVAAVQAMLDSGDPFLRAVVTKGQDLVAGASLGRRPTVLQQAAVASRSAGTCCVEGCAATVRLEHDHRVPWAASKITLVGGLDCLCGFHHDLKTYKGWALVAGVGKRAMVPPDDPRHPGQAGAAEADSRR